MPAGQGPGGDGHRDSPPDSSCPNAGDDHVFPVHGLCMRHQRDYRSDEPAVLYMPPNGPRVRLMAPAPGVTAYSARRGRGIP
jgi:hypothetical protein